MKQESIYENTVDGFRSYLTQLRKPNGEKLLSYTIEQYVRLYNIHHNHLKKVSGSELLYINKQLGFTNYPADISFYKHYLRFVGYDESHHIFNKVKSKKKNATFMSSQRVLQSKLLQPAEIEHLILEADPFLSMCIAVNYETASRREELLNIKARDVTMLMGEKFKSYRDKGIFATIRLHGKGGKDRITFLSQRSAEKILLYHKKVTANTYLFRPKTRMGRNIKNPESKYYNMVVELGMNALEKHIHPHMFRHSLGQHWADLGIELKTISSYMGHESVVVTEKSYVRNSSRQRYKGFTEFMRKAESIQSLYSESDIINRLSQGHN